MGFLNRIAYGLFSPKGLRAYAGDKIIKVLLYLLFLVCVTVIPVAIDSPNYGKHHMYKFTNYNIIFGGEKLETMIVWWQQKDMG